MSGPSGRVVAPAPAPFPGATAVTGLRVYHWPAPDGLPGGSAHLHVLSTEAYLVQSGSGRVQTLSSTGYAEHDLRPGDALWFTPGTVHRLVNTGGDLRLTVVMANAGLPEAGDAVLTFPPDVLEDPERYARAASLARDDRVYATDEAAARARRDLAVEGYLVLRDRVLADGPAALDELYRAAAALVRRRLPAWRELLDTGPATALRATDIAWGDLAAGGTGALPAASVRRIDAPDDERLGMCGWLSTYETDSARTV